MPFSNADRRNLRAAIGTVKNKSGRVEISKSAADLANEMAKIAPRVANSPLVAGLVRTSLLPVAKEN